jgi:hypothetical protein
MDDCCDLSRRQLLRLGAVGAATGIVLPGMLSAPSAAAASAGVFAQDLELVTVTDDSFVLTWYTASAPTPAIPYQPAQEPAPLPTDGYVRYGTDPGRLDRIALEHGGETAYHHVTVGGLERGRTYYYAAYSGGVPATPRLVPQLTYPAGGVVIPPSPTDAQLLQILAELRSTSASPRATWRGSGARSPAANTSGSTRPTPSARWPTATTWWPGTSPGSTASES